MSTYSPPASNLMTNFFNSDLNLGNPEGTYTPNLNVYGGSFYVSGISQLSATNIDTSVQSMSIFGSNGLTTNVSGAIALTSSTNAISLTSSTSTVTVTSSTTAGQITLASAGLVGGNGSIFVNATNATSGTVKLSAAGNVTNAVSLNATGGTSATIGLLSTGPINIQPAAGALNLATSGTSIPVNIGNTNSVVTINGELIVTAGSITKLVSEQVIVKDNVMTVNSGGTSAGLDAGYATRVFQTPNDAGTGDVVTGRIQETGIIGTGSTTTTIVLGPTASSVDNFYNGKVVRCVTTTAVRFIKSYVGSTKTATIYGIADNVDSATNYFQDGLDFLVAPVSGQTYNIYNNPYSVSFYNTTAIGTIDAAIANNPNQTLTTAAVQQYLPKTAGKYTSKPLSFANQSATASGTTISVTTPGGSLTLTVGKLIRITTSSGFTPTIATGVYTILTNASNIITFTAAVTTTNAANSTVAFDCLETSAIQCDYIFGNSLSAPIIAGFPLVTGTITLTQNSTTAVTITPNTSLVGAYRIMIQSVISGGACCIADRVKSQATDADNVVGGSISSTTGSTGEKVSVKFSASTPLQIYLSKIFSSGSSPVSYNYSIMYAGTY
jgi:hypothetical protein